ncbi:MAG: heme-binding protein [Dehalococcoidia bacterium]
MSITLSQAEKVLEAAKAEAVRLGVEVSVTIVDLRGDFKAGFRMDGADWYTAEVCRGKAFASANFGVPSGDLSEEASLPVFQSLLVMLGGRVVLGQGGVPIMQGDQVIGGVGVSGASAQGG